MTKEQQNQNTQHNTQQNKESNQQNQSQSTIKRIWQQNIKPAIIVLIKVVLCIIALPFVLFALGWLALKGYDLLFNGDLRAKKSYQREITINFEYKGKDYTMKPVVTCINNGTTINEGSMEWYTRWERNESNNILNLENGIKARFWFNSFYDELIEKAFETKIQGHEDSICGIILINNQNVQNIERMMRFYNKEQYLTISFNKISLDEHLSLIKEELYPNSTSNLINIRDLKYNEDLNIKFKSYQIGEKKLIN